MSYYIAEVGVYKINEEYRDDLRSFLHYQYDKVSSPLFSRFVDEYDFVLYYKNGEPRSAWTWHHDNYKEEWIGKFKTSFEDGVFTYGMNMNMYHGPEFDCWLAFKDLLKEIGQEIYSDFWGEDLWDEETEEGG